MSLAGSGGQIGSGSDILQQSSVEVMSLADCKAYLAGYTFTDRMVCLYTYDNTSQT